MPYLIIAILALSAAATATFGCVVLWAWLTTWPMRRLVLLSALVVVGVGGFWFCCGGD
jgi:hypothetical protein